MKKIISMVLVFIMLCSSAEMLAAEVEQENVLGIDETYTETDSDSIEFEDLETEKDKDNLAIPVEEKFVSEAESDTENVIKSSDFDPAFGLENEGISAFRTFGRERFDSDWRSVDEYLTYRGLYAGTLSTQGISFSFADPPEGDKDMDYTYSEEETDKALLIEMENVAHPGAEGEGLNKKNYWFEYPIYSYVDDNIFMISFNFYVDTAIGSGSLISCELRNQLKVDNRPSQLFTIRTMGPTGNLQFAGGAVVNNEFELKKWNHIMVRVNAKEETFSAYLNREPIANATDIPLHNRDAFDFSLDYPSGAGVSAVRFACQPSTNNVIREAKVYMDDLFIGEECIPVTDYLPTFETIGTAGSNGTQTEVPADLKSFKIQFPYSISSLERDVALTRGEDNTPVKFVLQKKQRWNP